MDLMLSMPGGSEWILLILFITCAFITPALAIYYYSKSKRLMRELENVTREKNMLTGRLMEKGGQGMG